MHEEREAAPGVSVLPLSGHGTQEAAEVLPNTVEKLFWGQGRHWEPCAGWYVPAAQGVQLALVAAPVLSVVVPSGQRVHKGEPAVGANLPAPHSKHAAAEVLPVSGLEVPAAHGKQAALEALPVMGLYAPAGQLAQKPAPARLYFPASQLWQEEATLLLHEPAGQGVQEYAVPALLKVPAGQLVQELALGALQVPAAQEVQEAIESPPGY